MIEMRKLEINLFVIETTAQLAKIEFQTMREVVSRAEIGCKLDHKLCLKKLSVRSRDVESTGSIFSVSFLHSLSQPKILDLCITFDTIVKNAARKFHLLFSTDHAHFHYHNRFSRLS